MACWVASLSFRVARRTLFAAEIAVVLLLMLISPVLAGAQTAHFSYAQLAFAGSYNNPDGVAVDNTGNVFVADTKDNAVKEIPAGCTTSSCVVSLGTGFNNPSGIAVDGSGNIFVADTGNGAVKEIAAAGGYTTVNTVRGGFSAPVGVALDASGNVFVLDHNYGAVFEILAAGGYSSMNSVASGFFLPDGLAVDGSGNLFVADTGNSVIWEIFAAGGYVNNVFVSFDSVVGIAVDASENLYVVGNSTSNMVYKLLASGGYTTTVRLGSGFSTPYGVAVNSGGSVLVADTGNSRVVKLDTASVDLGTVAIGQTSPTIPLTFTFDTGGTIGNPTALTQGASGLDFAVASGGTCAAGTYNTGDTCTVIVTLSPQYPGLRLGAVELLDGSGNRVANASAHGIGSGPMITFGPGIISTVAGNGTAGYNGDNTAATSAELNTPESVAVDAAGNLYIADYTNERIRKVSAATGVITTVAGNGYGNGNIGGYNGDNIAATSAELNDPTDVAVDGAGNLYIADFQNHRIRKVDAATGIITTVAGNGTAGYNGDNIAATSAELNFPEGVAVDVAGNVYIADRDNGRIRMVNAATGVITTVAGNGTAGYNSDNIAATSAELNSPMRVALDSSGNLYIADHNNQRIRKVTAATGLITTVAGNGNPGPYGEGAYSGDGGLATDAELAWPSAVTVDAAGDIYIADSVNWRIREVDAATGIITTVAGNGVQGYSGDGSLATNAEFDAPFFVALDGSGNFYIADNYNQRIRKVDVAEPPSLSFADTSVGDLSAAQDVEVNNLGNAPLDITQISTATNFTLGGADTSCATTGQLLNPAASCILGFEFAPQSTGTISGAVALTDNALNVPGTIHSISLSGTGLSSGGQTTPTVTTWPTANSITYGQTLQTSTLSGGVASVPGSFAFTTPNAAPAVGTAAQSVTFTPTDTTSYTTVAGTVDITVNPATLMVTANNQSRPYGQTNPALTYSITGYVNNDSSSVLSGSASCTTTATTSSPYGAYPITCTQGTLSAANYNFAFTAGTLTVTYVDLIEQNVSISGIPSSGGSLQVSDTVVNQGTGAAGGSTTGLYLSTDGTTKGSFLAYHYVATINAGANSGAATTTVTLPTGLSGTYYVIACANYNNGIVESTTANDCSASAPFSVSAADLVESAVSVLTSSPQAGGSLQISDTVTNQGGGSASASLTGFYLSTNGTTKGSYLGYRYVGILASGAVSGPVTTTVPLPTNLSGAYYVIVCANYNNAVVESSTANNCRASGSFTIAGADLAESAVSMLTSSPQAGGSLQVSDTVTNQGGGTAGGSLTGFYLSTNGTTKGSYLGYRYVGSLAPTAVSGPVTTTLTLPTNLLGTYYVIACANYNNAIADTNNSNNCSPSGSFTVAGADLVESAVSVLTASPQAGAVLQISDTVTNQGAGTASGSITGFYLSTNGTTKGSYLGYRYVGALAPSGVSGPVTTTVTLPANISGTYYVIACANYNNAAVESTTANNCTASGFIQVQ